MAERPLSGNESEAESDPELPSPERLKRDLGEGFRRKYTGASTYKSKYQVGWQKWPCVTPVKDKPHLFRCTLCCKEVSCGHQGERDVTRHIASVLHQRSAKAVKSTASLSFATVSPKSNNVLHKYHVW